MAAAAPPERLEPPASWRLSLPFRASNVRTY
jgi:hypothetical protein